MRVTSQVQAGVAVHSIPFHSNYHSQCMQIYPPSSLIHRSDNAANYHAEHHLRSPVPQTLTSRHPPHLTPAPSIPEYTTSPFPQSRTQPPLSPPPLTNPPPLRHPLPLLAPQPRLLRMPSSIRRNCIARWTRVLKARLRFTRACQCDRQWRSMNRVWGV